MACRETKRIRKKVAEMSPEELERWRERNRERKRAYLAGPGKDVVSMLKHRAYRRTIEFINEHKKECAGCGETEFCVLQFHHRDPEEKEMNVNKLSSQGRAKIIAEIAKCVVLCANCHLKVHGGVIECP